MEHWELFVLFSHLEISNPSKQTQHAKCTSEFQTIIGVKAQSNAMILAWLVAHGADRLDRKAEPSHLLLNVFFFDIVLTVNAFYIYVWVELCENTL